MIVTVDKLKLYVIVRQSCMVCTSTTCMSCWSAYSTVCYMHVVCRKTHHIHHLHVCKLFYHNCFCHLQKIHHQSQWRCNRFWRCSTKCINVVVCEVCVPYVVLYYFTKTNFVVLFLQWCTLTKFDFLEIWALKNWIILYILLQNCLEFCKRSQVNFITK